MNRRIDFMEIRSTRKRSVGLLGGSFDPAHAGHLHIASYAKKRLGLRQVWLLPTQVNPLKSGSSDFANRVKSADELLKNKGLSYRVCLSEARRNFYSWQSIEYLQKRHRDVRFVWLMGADCWDEFVKWRRWRHIFDLLPMVIFPRHPVALRAVRNRVGVVMRRYRVGSGRARLLRGREKGWVYFGMQKNYLSSSLLRGGFVEGVSDG